jgi:hypothetical protein
MRGGLIGECIRNYISFQKSFKQIHSIATNADGEGSVIFFCLQSHIDGFIYILNTEIQVFCFKSF